MMQFETMSVVYLRHQQEVTLSDFTTDFAFALLVAAQTALPKEGGSTVEKLLRHLTIVRVRDKE